MRKDEAIAIVLMAGKGERYNKNTPKQFLKIGQKELFLYSATTLNYSSLINKIIYVVPNGYENFVDTLLTQHSLNKDRYIISGGDSRQESTFIALDFLKKIGINDNDVVLIQDGDRPNLKERYIKDSIVAAKKYTASVVAIKINDSIAIKKDNSLSEYLPRENIYILQTPQTFKFSFIYEAEIKAKNNKKFYTDEGSLILNELSISPVVINGDKNNLKITEQFDTNIFLTEQLCTK